MNIPAEFDEIRPYTPEELPVIYEVLLADPQFQAVLKYMFPSVPCEHIATQLRSCKTQLDVQKVFCVPLLKDLVRRCADSLTLGCKDIEKNKSYTFVTNHRDIVLDSAFLSLLMLENDFGDTPEIAIGDNLLILPWIKHFVRVNKSFIVQRSLSMRQMLLSSGRLSKYMHYAVNEKHTNIWIAQREGRAKDSNDRTQDALLKMMAMGGDGTAIDRLRQLHIVPMALSYEYDPCDFLKAQEFQLKRDVEGFKKSPQDDLDNMYTGIFGRKGHIHFQAATCIDGWLDTLDPAISKTELFALVAAHIDKEIHGNYRLYSGNYVAADLLCDGNKWQAYYSEGEKRIFEDYINAQLDKVTLPQPDMPFLRERILTMYANPVWNWAKTLEK